MIVTELSRFFSFFFFSLFFSTFSAAQTTRIAHTQRLTCKNHHVRKEREREKGKIGARERTSELHTRKKTRCSSQHYEKKRTRRKPKCIRLYIYFLYIMLFFFFFFSSSFSSSLLFSFVFLIDIINAFRY